MLRKIPVLAWIILMLVPLALPAHAQLAPFPRRGNRYDTTVIPVRARQELCQLRNDDHRRYWLICPNGRLPVHYDLQQAGDPTPSTPRQDALGLIVALDSDENGNSALALWTEAAQSVFHGRYFIAIPMAPQWSKKQATPWITRNNLRSAPQATFATEDFLAEIVKDVCRSYEIKPERVYLHGVGESGQAVYTCSLDANTPFKGFYILSSNFRSSQAPPLSHAHGRRYLIQHSQEDKISPFWMAAAARKLLTEQGATVKLDVYHGPHGYQEDADLSSRLESAIHWLETGK